MSNCGCAPTSMVASKIDCEVCVEVIKNCNTPESALVVEPISWCAGNYTYTFTGSRITATPKSSPIADGVYSQFTVVDGCIVAAGQAPVPMYTPSECCDTPVGGGSEDCCDVEISNVSGNILSQLPDGLWAGFTLAAGNNISITQSGTTYTISATTGGSGGVYTASTTPGNLAVVNNSLSTIGAYLTTTPGDGILMTGDGSIASPLKVEVDFNSIVRSISSPDGSLIVGQSAPGYYTVQWAHPENLGGTYDDTFDLTFDVYGHLTDAVQQGPVYPTAFSILVPNAAPPVPPALTSGNFKITYDTFGRITTVELIP